jgi:hypothetical protein
MATPRVGAGSLHYFSLHYFLCNLICRLFGIVLFVQVIPDYSAIQLVNVKSFFQHHIIMIMDEFIAHPVQSENFFKKTG